jgi:nucleoporin NUP159
MVKVSWSPAGSQIAIGLSSGDIVQYKVSNSSAPVSRIRPPSFASGRPIISLTWLQNRTFGVIFGSTEPQGESIYSIYETNASGSASDIRLSREPVPPYGSPDRTSSPQTLVLRDWKPFSSLILMVDGPATDVGVVGKEIAGDASGEWVSIDMDESSSPTLPLDEDGYETAPMGFALDLSSTDGIEVERKNGEELSIPASPILYVYASDGSVVGWHVCNLNHPAYPSMVSPAAADAVRETMPVTQPPTPPVQQPPPPPKQEVAPPPPASPLPSEESLEDDDALVGLSLGGASSQGAKTAGPSIFGAGASLSPAVSNQPATSSPLRPSSGFGAFASSNNSPNAFFPSPASTATAGK